MKIILMIKTPKNGPRLITNRMTIKREWWGHMLRENLVVFLLKTALEPFFCRSVCLRWCFTSLIRFSRKWEMAQVRKPEHILFLESYKFFRGGFVKKKEKIPSISDVEVILERSSAGGVSDGSLVASDTLSFTNLHMAVPGAECCLEGSVQRISLEVRIRPLMERARKKHIWSTLNDIVKKIIHIWRLKRNAQN